MTTLENRTFDEERALYGSRGLTLSGCRFTGPADGESALKESADITADACLFDLRYPFWHTDGLHITGCTLTGNCRAALWYARRVRTESSRLHGIKAFRECDGVDVAGCDIVSDEFGWFCRGIALRGCTAAGSYGLLHSSGVRFDDVVWKGNYGLQYLEGAEITGCDITGRDILWHARGVTVRDSFLKGDYLAWYSEDLTLERCRIISTQPLCYCRGLRLIDCEVVDSDLCFEKSDVEAVITTPVDSIKNPRSGRITLPAVDELIMDDPEARAEIVIGG